MKVLSLVLLTATISTNVFAQSSSLCPNESGFYYTNYRQRNPTQGGFVSNQAYVEDSDSVFISPTAAVCGSSSVTGRVKIFGTAVITNATITGNVNIKDNARIIGANVSDDAVISGNAYVNGTDVIIREKAQVSGNAKVTGDAIIGGAAIIGGYARIATGVYSTEIIKPVRAQDTISFCGLSGSIDDRIKDCSFWDSSAKGNFVLVTRTKEFKEVHKDIKSGTLWGDHLELVNYNDALTICKSDLPEVGGISGAWRIPSKAEFEAAETNGVRAALPNMKYGHYWSVDAWIYNATHGYLLDGTYSKMIPYGARCVAL